jgi:hypothetical protein
LVVGLGIALTPLVVDIGLVASACYSQQNFASCSALKVKLYNF